MRKFFYLFAFFLVFSPKTSTAQVCNLVITPPDTTVCPGDTVCIDAYASITSTPQSFDFNQGVMPAGWSTTGTAAFSQPCGPNPTGTNYYWASTAVGTPQIATAAYDVSCGGFLVFDMRYEEQGGGVPCEGPDLAHEGVSVQYSLNNGATWFDIIYYRPDGVTLPSNPQVTAPTVNGPTPMTTWNTYTVQLPVGSMSTSTMFRWVQFNSSGSCCDNWGLDNIFVNAGPCNTATVNWSNGLVNTTSFCTSQYVDSSYIAYVYDTLGNLQCQDTVTVSLYSNTIDYDLVDTVMVYCPGTDGSAAVSNLTGALPPVSYNWSTGSTTNSTIFPGSPNEHDTTVYFLDVSDGCGFTYPDTVVFITNKILNVDSLVAIPASSCNPTGSVSAYVSGVTQVQFNPIYYWEDSVGNAHGGQSWNNISPGWYYFTIDDDVCEDSDSVFVDQIDKPEADFDMSTSGGCAPLDVTFYNTSPDGAEWHWNFGNGLVVASDMNPITQTYTTSTGIWLVAVDQYGCASDTVDAWVTIHVCDCTDPDAVNYNPMATVDDGSCFYPEPTVVVPNVFTPNGDNINDFFEMTVTNATEIKLVITNRWGNLMMEETYDLTNPITQLMPKGWSGLTPSGTKAPEGTYFYTYEVTGIDKATKKEGHGFLQLVRD